MNKTVTTYDNITAYVYFSTVDCFFFPVPLSRYIHVLLKKHDQTNDLFRGAAITIFDLRRYFFPPRYSSFHTSSSSPRRRLANRLCLSAHTHPNAHTRARPCELYGLGFCSDCEFMKSWRLHPPPTRRARSVLYSRLSKGTPLKSSRRRDGTVHLYTVGKHEESKNILTYLHWKTVRAAECCIKSYL